MDNQEQKNTSSIASNITKQIDEAAVSKDGDWVLDKILTVVNTGMCIIMVLLVWYQIIGRNLNITVTWTDEMCRYIMIIFTFFGAALAINTDEHIRIQIIKDRLSKPVQLALDIIESILTAVFLGFCIYGAYSMAKQSWTVPVGFTSKSLSIGHIYMLIGLGLAVQELYLIRFFWYQHILPSLNRHREKKKEGETA